MYLLDTHVISELRKAKTGKVDRNVRNWARSVSPSMLFVSVLSILELEIGIHLIERRDQAQGTLLRSWMADHVLPTFDGRILTIDTTVALRCAALHVPARRSDRDALIAGTALVHGMTIVTRNLSDFEPTGASVMNPWKA